MQTDGGSTVLVPFAAPAREAVFIGRRRRFLVDCLMDGEPVTIHSNNTGSMLGLTRPGSRILASPAASPGRRLPYTQEAVHVPGAGGGFWVGVDTSMPGRVLAAAHRAGLLPCPGWTRLRREVPHGASRLDALLEGDGLPPLWVECKNVTLVEDDVALFPDARSERAQKHLVELTGIVREGGRAAMFYLVQRPDGRCLGPADVVDPAYADLFWRAVDAGVDIWAFRARVEPEGVTLGERLPLARRP